MNKYNTACIYKIYNKLNPEEFYIGSTIQSLTRRFQSHKALDSSKKTHISLYDVMLEKGFDKFDIELVCCYENCENQKQLKILEQEVMDELKPTINKYRAYCNEEQTKQRIIEYKNLPTTKKRAQEREKLRDRTQYYIDNKEKIAQHYIDNKEKIQKRRKTKITCVCGKEFTKSNSRHKKSKHHQDFINNN
jgi:hypothetical protein